MQKLCDFSWGRPGALNIKNAGYVGVIRYLSDDTTGKNLSAAERDEYFAEGLTIRLVYENGAQAALNGMVQGLRDGQDALNQAKALGYPEGYGIYYAVDFQPTTDQLNAVREYGEGFTKGLTGFYKAALYGGYATVNGNGTSWQTCAWSDGKVASNANIYQNGQSDFGGAVDVDQLLIDDGWNWTKVSDTGAPAQIPKPVETVAKPAPTNGPGGTYTVLSGDTLSGIGNKVGVDWQAIAQLNNISAPFTIYANEVLELPGNQENPEYLTIRYVVKPGDTLTAIASHYGISVTAIASVNHISDPNNIDAGQILVIPSPSNAPIKVGYTVQKGDTLSSIGSKLGVNWHKIASINNIPSPFVIYPGQELRIN